MRTKDYAVGDRVETFCEMCGEERVLLVATVTKTGKVSRAFCSKCRTTSSFISGHVSAKRQSSEAEPYDRTRTYRAGQTIVHPNFGHVGVATIHIVPNPDGGWSVKKGDASRASKHFDKKEDAVAWGRSISKRQGTEFVIHGRDGTVVRRDSYVTDPDMRRPRNSRQ